MDFTRSLRALLAAAALMAVACDEKLSDLTGPTPNLEPTFASIAQNIFQTTDSSGRVACTQCHTASDSMTLRRLFVLGLVVSLGIPSTALAQNADGLDDKDKPASAPPADPSA